MTHVSGASKYLPNALRSLGQRNFRLYFAGHAISILGSWIQQVALSWLVYKLTGSAALLGITSCCSLLPQLIIGPFAGAWVDKCDKKKLLIAIQLLLTLQAFLLAGLTDFEAINPSLIVVMALMLGVLNSFDTPLRQALICTYIDEKSDLPNALALNAMLFNGSRFIGPPLAGLLLSLTSEAVCFWINGLSFIALISALLLIKIKPQPVYGGAFSQAFQEGIKYAWNSSTIRTQLLSLAVLNLTASSYAVLLPIFASDVFFGDANTLGWLWGGAGFGAFLGTIWLATLSKPKHLSNTIQTGIFISSLSAIVFSFANEVSIAIPVMAALGFGISVCNVGTNVLLQSISPDAFRGRIVSFFTSIRFGFDALGALVAGLLATWVGASYTLLLEGILLLLFATYLAARARTHASYP